MYRRRNRAEARNDWKIRDFNGLSEVYRTEVQLTEVHRIHTLIRSTKYSFPIALDISKIKNRSSHGKTVCGLMSPIWRYVVRSTQI